MTTKRCFKCLCEKPFEAFYKHAAMGDGRLGKCKECTKLDAKKHRQENLESMRVYDRTRRQEHLASARAYDKLRASQPHRVALAKKLQVAWRAKHPDRLAAHEKVRLALRNGQLRQLPCLVCGEKSEGHHPDYSRPLDVVWLCPAHHKQAHALIHSE